MEDSDAKGRLPYGASETWRSGPNPSSSVHGLDYVKEI